jgi:hypothetical protein
MDSQAMATFSFCLSIFSFVLVYNMYTNMKKIKQLLFGIMFILNEQRKDEGKESDLQDIYNKGKNL